MRRKQLRFSLLRQMLVGLFTSSRDIKPQCSRLLFPSFEQGRTFSWALNLARTQSSHLHAFRGGVTVCAGSLLNRLPTLGEAPPERVNDNETSGLIV